MIGKFSAKIYETCRNIVRTNMGKNMTDKTVEDTPKYPFLFIQGAKKDTGDVKKVKQAIAKSLNTRNVAFLLGAGCSSLLDNDKRDQDGNKMEVGVPTMEPLAKEFMSICKPEFQTQMNEKFGIDIDTEEYSSNLEKFMEILFSLRFILKRSSRDTANDELKIINSLIEKVKTFILEKCDITNDDNKVIKLYEKFYRILLLRDRSSPKPWVFTTNYDLFNEISMDRIGMHYANGFSGVIERGFNPATFRYALAEQLDITNRKWSAVDGFVYLCKLHGSINWDWVEDNHGLFPIREITNSQNSAENVMIYPTPAKQNASLGSPYTDLFREFQSRIVQEQSVLFTMGYAFGDEHINNIIYQALTIPTFRLVIFADPELPGAISKLRELGDPRIWIIGSEGDKSEKKAHYFETIIDDFMPQQPSERIEGAVKEVRTEMISKKIDEDE